MKKNKVIDVVEDILQTRSEDKNKRTTAERIVNTLVDMQLMLPNSFCYYACDDYDTVKNALSVAELDGGIKWEDEE